MKLYKERREEERAYHNDVCYHIWRNGGNTDAIDYDRVQDSYLQGHDVDDVVRSELRHQHPKPRQPSENEYYNKMHR